MPPICASCHYLCFFGCDAKSDAESAPQLTMRGQAHNERPSDLALRFALQRATVIHSVSAAAAQIASHELWVVEKEPCVCDGCPKIDHITS